MKVSRLLAVFAAAACLMPAVARANSIAICNTGQAALCVGTVADGTLDPNYVITGGTAGVISTTQAAVQDGFPIPSPWLADDADSKWIAPFGSDNDSNGPVGTYIYTTTFSLAGLNRLTASISGKWSSDNDGLDVRLNGVSIPQLSYPPNAGFGSLYAFLVPVGSGFLDGPNTLDFILSNAGGPTGLRVDDISGTADPLNGRGPEVPEPASMVLLGSGLLALYRRRRGARQ